MSDAPSKTVQQPASTGAKNEKKSAPSVPPGKTATKAKATPKSAASKAPEKASPNASKAGSNTQELARDKLRNMMAEIERLEAEKKVISDDISEIFKAAKAEGLDPDIMKLVLKRQKMTRQERENQELQLGLYESTLGLDSTAADVHNLAIQAASEGQPVTSNPYIKNDPRHKQWIAAWQLQTTVLAAKDAPAKPEAA
ncbi:GapR family DNA-binding domain-containing protein [Roseibium alexandrii]